MSELVSLAKAYDKYFKIGAAVCPMCIQKHHDLILRHFSSITPENEMKYESIEPEEGVLPQKLLGIIWGLKLLIICQIS